MPSSDSYAGPADDHHGADKRGAGLGGADGRHHGNEHRPEHEQLRSPDSLCRQSLMLDVVNRLARALGVTLVTFCTPLDAPFRLLFRKPRSETREPRRPRR